VIVDDMRGTTSRKIVKMVRAAGAKEVHLRISSPPTKWPCYYGIDTPTRAELIASSHNVEEINQYITSDSLSYLSIQEMHDAVMSARIPPPSRGRELPVIGRSLSNSSFCDACWSGNYPVEFTAPPNQRQMRLLDI
jgi:amidophosphoribosyltransferase